ncbi:MAG: hypothetical protein KJ698_00490 [Actinobacteria bacterium]|nr:hypothetical protein [Actinomycetota bacterium]MBU1493920.1 hypothetical protein [Actinomycetota bacterium]
MEVRHAARGDLLEIARIAHQSLWDACDGLLQPSTIAATLDHEYSPTALTRRLRAGRFLVAVDTADRMVGVAESGVSGEHVTVKILSMPGAGRRCWGPTALIDAVRARYPGRALCADVLLGSVPEERWCEAAGFFPGEIILRTLYGEEVIERRWWCRLAE